MYPTSCPSGQQATTGGGGARAMSGAPEGEMAPDFTLYPPQGGEPVTLSAFRDKKPVVLIFGSYT